MSFFGSTDFLIEVAKGNIAGHSIINKFGSNDSVGTSLEPVTQGGVYQVPQVGSATTLRVKAGNVNDTAAGSGAQEVTLEGLDETGALVTESLATAGTSASSATTATFIRLFRAYVSKSGTYADATTPSHADEIVIEDSSGTNDWLTIALNSFARGQSEVAVYSVPTGKSAYLLSAQITADSTRTTEVILFRRTGILQTAAPYDAMRMLWTATTNSGELHLQSRSAAGPYQGPCDIGWMAMVDQGTARVAVNYEILLVDD